MFMVLYQNKNDEGRAVYFIV